MGRDLPRKKRRTDLRSFGHAVRHDVAHAEPGEPVVFAIHEQWRSIVQTNRAAFKVSLQGFDGFRPQGARPFLLTFAMDAHVVWAGETKVIHVETNQLLS